MISVFGLFTTAEVCYTLNFLQIDSFASQENRTERKHDKVFVTVRDNNVDQALRVLKKKMQREGLFREMKNRRSYEKPSERRARENAESTRRVRKLMRKRMEREGF
jgi:small subunit ribosomal protein S21